MLGVDVSASLVAEAPRRATRLSAQWLRGDGVRDVSRVHAEAGYDYAARGAPLSVHFAVSLDGPIVDGSCVVVLSGEADLFGAPRLKELLLGAIEAGAKRIVIDMTDTHFVDSTILGVLIGASKRLRPDDGEVVLVINRPPIRKIFEITLLDRAFLICATRDDALATR